MTAAAPAGAAPGRPTRLLDVLQAAAGYLDSRGVPEARLVSEWLFSHVLGCRRLDLYLRFETVLTPAQLDALRAGVRRLGGGEPLQYVVGDCEFMGHRFAVDPRVLIPRPDTECLAGIVLGCAPLWQRPAPAVIDVGTGSGCLALTVALARPAAVVWAVDISQAALEAARENAAALALPGPVRFEWSDLLTAVPAGGFDAVMANLPYIRTADCETLPRHIRDFEPRGALDGGADGLDALRKLAAQAPAALKPGGWLFLEIGSDQGAAVRTLIEQHGFVDVRVDPDLGQRDRVVWGRLRGTP